MSASDMKTALFCTVVSLAFYAVGFLRGLVQGHKLGKAGRP